MANGYVYILANKFFVGPSGLQLLKIGGTNRSAYERARELSTTGVPGDFFVAFESPTRNWKQLESFVHRQLRSYRRAGEFFEVELQTAINCIEEIQRQVGFLRDFEVPYLEVESRPVPDVGVCFVKEKSGYSVHSDGIFVGDLWINDTSALYNFSPEREILFAEIFALPGPGSNWSRLAVARESKRRAAWIAPILRAFTSPTLSAMPQGNRGVNVNGLPVAVLSEEVRHKGLFRRREEITYDLQSLPYREDVSLEDGFSSKSKVAPSKLRSERNIFVASPSLDIIESVRLHILQSLFVTISMSTRRWRCTVDLIDYSVEFAIEAD